MPTAKIFEASTPIEYKDYIDKQIEYITTSLFPDNMYGHSYQDFYIEQVKKQVQSIYIFPIEEIFGRYKNVILEDMKTYNVESIKTFITSNDSGYYYDLEGNEFDDYDEYMKYLNKLSEDDVREIFDRMIQGVFDMLDINTFDNYLEEIGCETFTYEESDF